MNQGRFQAMIRRHAKRWLRECNKGRLPHRVQLVMDHEKCLWADRSLEILRRNHLHPILDHPPSSQDLHVIEGVWAHLRKKLHASAPVGTVRREGFIKRLQGAECSLHTSGKDMLSGCREVLRRKGGRIDY